MYMFNRIHLYNNYLIHVIYFVLCSAVEPMTTLSWQPCNQACYQGVQPNCSPCTNNHCSTRYVQTFDTINIHTLIRKLLQIKIPGTSIKLIVNYIKGTSKPTQHIETTHPYNVNFKLAFPKVASYHPHYLTFTR